MSTNIFWCKNCLNMSTRPRITFDDKGWCNACQWMTEKKTLDWDTWQLCGVDIRMFYAE